MDRIQCYYNEKEYSLPTDRLSEKPGASKKSCSAYTMARIHSTYKYKLAANTMSRFIAILAAWNFSDSCVSPMVMAASPS